MDTTLSLRFLGSWEVQIAADKVTLRGRKAMALLAYLAVEGGERHSRASLLGLLWPEMGEDEARNNLRVVLARLRKALPEGVIESNRHEVWWAGTAVSHLDTAQFQQLITATVQHPHTRRAECAHCAEKMTTAVSLYRSDFLTGFYLDDCPAFDEWLFVQREGLHVQMLTLLAELSQFYEATADYAAATAYTRRQIELDPLQEGAHRQLMRLLTYQGQRTAALAQFQTCRRILHAELGIDPDADTLHLYQQIKANRLAAAPLPPSAPAAGQPRHNLPQSSTPFIGREQELAQLSDRLARPSYRLISLVGAGGMGKTRLALQAARENRHHFADGTFFVSLAAAKTVAEAVTAVAGTLQVKLDPTADPAQALIAGLQNQHVLLLLDNLEHLMAMVPLLLDLLAQAPRVTLLVTSRERLNVQAEDLFRLRGLPVPATAELAAAGQFASVRLFADRAYRLNKAFKLDETTLAAVVQICRAVEGMPLALELAASWLRDLTVQELAAQIRSSVDMLAADWRDLAPQHRSVRAVFDYSWRLLTPAEQALLPQLSVFAGGFSLAAARQVAAANPVTLTGLRYKSLLYAAGHGRYDSHELLRQLAAEKLAADGAEATAVRRRHSAYFLQWVARLTPALHGEQPQLAQQEIRGDLDNVRAAWQWAMRQPEAGHWTDCLPGLARFYSLSGLYREGEQVFQQALAALDQRGERASPRRVTLLCELAEMEVRLGKVAEALAHVAEAVTLSQRLGDARHQAKAYLLWGYALDQAGKNEAARQQLTRGLTLAQQAGDQPLQGGFLRYLASAEADFGRRQQAVAYLQQALTIQRAVGNRMEEQAVLLYLGVIHLEQGLIEQGRDYLQAALALSDFVGSRALEARLANATGFALAALGDFAAAMPYHDRSRRIAREIGESFQESHARHNLCTVQRKLGNLADAEAHGREALRLAQVYQHPDPEAYAWLHLGYVWAEQGQTAEALDAWRQSRAGWLAQERHSLAMEALAGTAVCHHRLGESDTAVAVVNELLAYLAERSLDGADEPFQVYLYCLEVLQAQADPRAGPLLQRAYNALMANAALIGLENRERFLQIPAHARLTAVYHRSAPRKA